MALDEQDQEDAPEYRFVNPIDWWQSPGQIVTSPTEAMGAVGSAVKNLFTPSESPSVPANANPAIVAQAHQPHVDSEPLIAAIDSGYADKKIIGPIESIREGIRLFDQDPKKGEGLVKKGHKALADLLYGERSFGDWYTDTFARSGADRSHASRIAGDVVMREIQNATGMGMPTAETASRLGLIEPSELLPSQQQQVPGYAHLIPEEPFTMSPEGVPATSTEFFPTPAQPGQQPSGEMITQVHPEARLNPMQEEVASSRQKMQMMGFPLRKELNAIRRMDAETRRMRAEEGEKAGEYKRTVETPARLKSLAALDQLRSIQGDFYRARTQWYNNLPNLRKELSAGSSFELEAVKRVHSAMKAGEQPERADLLIALRWLTKGAPQFGVDFTGKVYDKLTGQTERKGNLYEDFLDPKRLQGLTPEERLAGHGAEQDWVQQFMDMLGGLLGGSTTPMKEEAPTTLSKDEQAELERLRKKYGK